MQATQKSHVIAEEAVAHKYTLSEIYHISELTLDMFLYKGSALVTY